MSKKTLYDRLGGYDGICAVANDLLPRLQADPRLARFWQHRGDDGVRLEKQLPDRFSVLQCRRAPVLHRTRHEDDAQGADDQ